MSSTFNTYMYIVKTAGVLKDVWDWSSNRTSEALNDMNPNTPPPDDTLAYSLTKGVTRFFSPRVYDEDGSPYDEFSQYMKDTETGDLLLREAAKLRQKARILLKQREEEEKSKRHAASSRYF